MHKLLFFINFALVQDDWDIYLSLVFCLLIGPLFQEQLINYLINSRATGDTVLLLLFLQGRDGVPGQPGIKGQQGRMVSILQFELLNNHQILLLQHADSGLNSLLHCHHYAKSSST